MLKIIIRRIALSIPLIIGITFISFMLIQLAPGDYLSFLKMNPQVSEETVKKLTELYGLDKNIFLQYLKWLWRILHFDLGMSIAYKTSVSYLISSRALNTLILSLSSILFSWTLAFGLGIFSTWRRWRLEDSILLFISYIIMSLPSFLLSFFLLYIASRTGYFPLGGTYSPEYFFLSPFEKIADRLHHLILPTLAIGIPSAGYLYRLIRSNFIEFVDSTFIRAVRGRGAGEFRILFVHVMRNAINPFITILGFEFSSVLSGAALTEIILNLQGLGSLLLKAVLAQDLYLIMGSVLISSVLLVLGNLFSDITLAICDPRVRVE